MSEELKAKVGNLYFQPYSEKQKNIIVVGPVPGKTYSEMTFPILSPDPATDKDVYFLKYPIYLGGNRGRGQIYPTGEKVIIQYITHQRLVVFQVLLLRRKHQKLLLQKLTVQRLLKLSLLVRSF